MVDKNFKEFKKAIEMVLSIAAVDYWNPDGGINWADNDIKLEITFSELDPSTGVYYEFKLFGYDGKVWLEAGNESVALAAKGFVELLEREIGTHAVYDRLTVKQEAKIWNALSEYDIEWTYSFKVIFSDNIREPNEYVMELFMKDNWQNPLWSQKDVCFDWLTDKLIEAIHTYGRGIEETKVQDWAVSNRHKERKNDGL